MREIKWIADSKIFMKCCSVNMYKYHFELLTSVYFHTS